MSAKKEKQNALRVVELETQVSLVDRIIEDSTASSSVPDNLNGPLVAEVFDLSDLKENGQARVRWTDAHGRDCESVVGTVRELQLAKGDQVLLSKPSNWPHWLITNVLSTGETTKKTATVDGKKVEIVGQEEIVFRCGDSSIKLRRDGRVIVRGRYIETYAKGTNRIKGGSVLIN